MGTPIEFKDIRPGDTVRRILTHEVKVVDREDRWLHADDDLTLTDATTVFDVTWELVDRPVKPLKPGTVVKGELFEWVIFPGGGGLARSLQDGEWAPSYYISNERLAREVASGGMAIVWEPSE